MIGFIRGILWEKNDGYVTVDVNGVGYEICVSKNSKAYLCDEGKEVVLYTKMTVREDDVSIYGFSEKNERRAFNKLITVSGIGAKAAMSLLSTFSVDMLHQAIVYEDPKTLTKANGIGKKTAERIILELRDKFDIPGISSEVVRGEGSGEKDVTAHEMSSPREEAVEALMALGYSRGEAAGVVSKISDDHESAEDYIKSALKNLF